MKVVNRFHVAPVSRRCETIVPDDQGVRMQTAYGREKAELCREIKSSEYPIFSGSHFVVSSETRGFCAQCSNIDRTVVEIVEAYIVNSFKDIQAREAISESS